MKQKIKEAAILDTKTGSVYTGRRHGDIMKDMVELYGIQPPVDAQNFEQGFITNDNEFLDRHAAGRVAIAAGQIPALKWPPLLYSEDLY